MPLLDILTAAASESGCRDKAACKRAILDARSRGTSAIDVLLDEKIVEEEAFLQALAKKLSLEYAEQSEMDLSESLHHKFPAKLALRHRILPTRLDNHDMALMTYDPFNLDAKQAVGMAFAKDVTWVVSPRRQIVEALKLGYGVGAEHWDEMLEGRDAEDVSNDLDQEVNVLDEQDEDATVMSFVNQIFREALQERATDIHIEPLEQDLRIRYRIDGALQEITVPPNMRLLQASLISRLKIMAHLDIAERRLPQDGRINLQLDGSPIDVRVATIPSVNGESVSLRLLTRENFDFTKLGLTPACEATIRDLLALPNGIILVTGPTGSGKSTTLYTFLKILNQKDTRIVTIEDPVENKLDGVVQIAVKPDIGLTFASGLRSILRGDPNIVMVGEMRDVETVEIAIRAALTGHLVFSTLHTNDAVGGITRLLDMGIEPFLIASSVRAFIAQRLVRTLCPACKQPADYEDEYLSRLGFPLEHKLGIRRAGGCRECRGTGYRGRMAIVEICPVSSRLHEMITSNVSATKLKPAALEEGMITLRDDGWSKVAAGLTTIEEVITSTAAAGS